MLAFSREIGDIYLIKHKKNIKQLTFINKGRSKLDPEVTGEDMVKSLCGWVWARRPGLVLSWSPLIIYQRKLSTELRQVSLRQSMSSDKARGHHGANENPTLCCLPWLVAGVGELSIQLRYLG